MKSDELLKKTLEQTGLPAKYQEYRGTKEAYLVYNVKMNAASPMQMTGRRRCQSGGRFICSPRKVMISGV